MIVREIISKDQAEATETISSVAYQANQQPMPGCVSSISSLFPLFTEESNSVAMMRHSLEVAKNTVEALNPGQIPIATFNQTLIKLTKQIQWCWLDDYG